MALYNYVDLDENAILNFSDFYADKTPKNDLLLQRFDSKILTRAQESKEIKELQKNIFLKLKDNENIGILIVDYNMIFLIERNYNSLDFKRMIFIFVSDLCRQKCSPFAYDAEIKKFEEDTKNNIVMLSHYNGSGVECRIFDKEYEEVF
jgi:hypothetical protein